MPHLPHPLAARRVRKSSTALSASPGHAISTSILREHVRTHRGRTGKPTTAVHPTPPLAHASNTPTMHIQVCHGGHCKGSGGQGWHTLAHTPPTHTLTHHIQSAGTTTRRQQRHSHQPLTCGYSFSFRRRSLGQYESIQSSLRTTSGRTTYFASGVSLNSKEMRFNTLCLQAGDPEYGG
jgi:hypothetical protein